MTDRELLKEARDLIVMCSLLDESNQCNEMVNKMDKQLDMPLFSGLTCECGNHTFTHRHSNWIECTACNKIQVLKA